jgi:hypothetical protein
MKWREGGRGRGGKEEGRAYLDKARPPHAIQPPQDNVFLHVLLQVRQTCCVLHGLEICLSGGWVTCRVHNGNDQELGREGGREGGRCKT